ncbi:MAG: hypothetical protein HOQ47_05255 [Streptomyces sp.]|nr:hypothetical protein [Streptomyces sp.]
MSTSTTSTEYRFGFYLQHPGKEAETAFFTLTDASGMDDSSALALANAMKNVTWPTGVAATVTVERNDLTDVRSEGDLSASPPAFT